MSTEPLTAEEAEIMFGLAEQAFTVFYTVKAEYCKLRPRGLRSLATDKYQKRFYEIAQLCRSRQWDVEGYIRSAFVSLEQNFKYVTPSNLLNEKCILAYELSNSTKNTGTDPKQLFDDQILELVREMRQTGKTEQALLSSAFTGYDAWFRLFYPDVMSDELLGLFGQMARSELAKNKKLRYFLREQFPSRVSKFESIFGGFGDITKEMLK